MLSILILEFFVKLLILDTISHNIRANKGCIYLISSFEEYCLSTSATALLDNFKVFGIPAQPTFYRGMYACNLEIITSLNSIFNNLRLPWPDTVSLFPVST